jgi:hypothetical protein
MRKRLLLLALSLIAFAASVRPGAAVSGGYFCPSCITYPDGSQCCVSCWCDGHGNVVSCTDNYCPEDLN